MKIILPVGTKVHLYDNTGENIDVITASKRCVFDRRELYAWTDLGADPVKWYGLKINELYCYQFVENVPYSYNVGSHRYDVSIRFLTFKKTEVFSHIVNITK